MTVSVNKKSSLAPHKSNNIIRFVGLGVLIFLCIIFVAALFDRQQKHIHQMSAHRNAAEIGDQLGAAIENEINKRLVMVQALSAFKKFHKTFTNQEFLDFATEVEAGEDGIISLQFAPDGVVRYVTQPEKNAKAIGHDLLADPERSQLALRSIETGGFLIAGPINLKQGGLGLIARKPLYETAPNGSNEFWGFATIVLDFSTVSNLLARPKEQSQYRYALRHGNDGTAIGNAFWGDSEIFQANPHLTEIKLAAGTWVLATLPASGWPIAWPFATAFRIAAVIVAALMTALAIMILRKPEQLKHAVDVATNELKVTELELREAHRIAKIGSWTVQPDGKVVFSKEALNILGAEKNVYRKGITAFYDAIHPEDRTRIRSEIRKASRHFGKIESTFRIQHTNGETIYIRMNAESHQISGKGQKLYRGSIQDITQETSNEERLRRAQKMEAIGQLTGGIAHDFNNLLSVIQGNAELLELSLNHDQDLLTEIQNASHRGAALTHRLLAYARKQPLSPKTTNLTSLIQSMERILARTIGENIQIDLSLPKDLWHPKVDAGQIEDALLNLAINSRDAMENGGRLTIQCENVTLDEQSDRQNSELEDGKFVLLSVSDTGTGMGENVISQAFEPFFTTKEVGKGSGLGLSMVSGLAKQLGGDVTIESQLGLGTTVRIYLPCDETSIINMEKERPSFETQHGSGELILLVEDDSVVGTVLSRTLIGLGYQVLEASDAIAARSLLEARSDIDLVLTDVVLPGGMSGLDLAAEIKRDRRKQQVIIMSGYPLQANAQHSETLAEHPLLKKPFSRSDLAKILRAKLGNEFQRSGSVSIMDFRRAQ